MVNLHKLMQLLQYFWQLWNLRGFILFSFSLQCVLIIGSSLRIQTARPWVHKVIWLVYLLADWAAYYAIGLVVPINRLKDKDTYDIRSFWAPFLLLHIGGPNTIAGFSLEDNELWDRSVMHIAVQAGATVIAIVRSLSKKRLLAPTLLVFVAAITWYAGRILALRNGSLESLRESIRKGVPRSGRRQRGEEARDEAVNMVIPVQGDDSSGSLVPLEPLDIASGSYELFQKFKGAFCGLSVPMDEEVKRVGAHLQTLRPRQAVMEMEIELGFAYDLFYTKIWTIVEDKHGWRLHLVSLASEVAALLMWIMANKHGYEKVDVKITYALLVGGVVLDVVSILKLAVSDLAICHMSRHCSGSRCVASALNMALAAKKHGWAKRCVLFRRWSGSIKQFNLTESHGQGRGCCYKIPLLCKLWDRVCRCEEGVTIAKLDDEVKDLIFWSIYVRGRQREGRCGTLGGYVLDMYDDKELMANAMQQICKGLGAVRTLIMWHMTTHLFYSSTEHGEGAGEGEKETIFHKCNRQLSEYFIYLLFHQPMMILVGIQLDMTVDDMKQQLHNMKDQSLAATSLTTIPEFELSVMQRYEEAEQDAWETQRSDIAGILDDGSDVVVKGGESLMDLVLVLACYMVRKLERKEETEAIMSEIWIDLLLYAAGCSRGRNHVQQLGSGGQLLTLAWLMTKKLDLTIQLPAGRDQCSKKTHTEEGEVT